jgi:predicted enzyme related to lactoylglutathione lyase
MAIAHSPSFVYDCPDAGALARFYGALLGWEVQVDDDGTWAEIRSGDHTSPICFQQVTDYRAPEWPGQDLPQQAHLDVRVADLDEAEARVVELGASRAEHQPGETFRVFLDPVGHPFCLCLS